MDCGAHLNRVQDDAPYPLTPVLDRFPSVTISGSSGVI